MNKSFQAVDVIRMIVNSVSSCPAIKISDESMRRIMPAGMRIEHIPQLLEILSLQGVFLSYDSFGECYVAVSTQRVPLIECPQGWIDDLMDVAKEEFEEILKLKAAGVPPINWAEDK